MSISSMSGPLYVGGVPVGPSFGLGPRPGRTFFLNAGQGNGYSSGIPLGSDSNDGMSWETPFATLAKFINNARTFDRLYFVGDVREEALSTPYDAFDVQIIGCGSQHHPDNPDSTDHLYHTGGSMIRPPASPTATTDLITVNARGWQFINIAFDAPVDASCIVAVADNGSGTSEKDASHMSIINCSAQQGKYFLTASGGLSNVSILGGSYRIFSPAGAVVFRDIAGAGVRANQFWRFEGIEFPSAATVEGNKGNQSHINISLNSSKIIGCTFGTVESTDLYVDLTGGQDNQVCFNEMNGNYATDDYVSATGDTWYGNRCKVTSTTAPDGVSILVPAA